MKQAEPNKEMGRLQGEYGQLVQKIIGPDRVKDKDEAKKINDQLTKVRKKLIAAQKESGADYDTHGWVWLFLREPAVRTTAGVR